MEKPQDRLHARLAKALEDGAAGQFCELVDIESRTGTSGDLDDGLATRRTERGLEIRSGRRRIALQLRQNSPDWWASPGRARSIDAIGGLVASSLLAPALQSAIEDASVGAIPVPAATVARATQLAVLYRRLEDRAREGTDDATAREALVGSLDRCIADLYDLPLSLLMAFETRFAS